MDAQADATEPRDASEVFTIPHRGRIVGRGSVSHFGGLQALVRGRPGLYALVYLLDQHALRHEPLLGLAERAARQLATARRVSGHGGHQLRHQSRPVQAVPQPHRPECDVVGRDRPAAIDRGGVSHTELPGVPQTDGSAFRALSGRRADPNRALASDAFG